MKLTDDQIRSIMQKEGIAKTVLIDNAEVENTIGNYQKNGWKLVKKSEIIGRTKLTFEK